MGQSSVLGASIFPWGLFTLKKAPKTYGFHYILPDVTGQQKKKKARSLGPSWTVSDDTGLSAGGDAGN
jgi:hypothetical protein